MKKHIILNIKLKNVSHLCIPLFLIFSFITFISYNNYSFSELVNGNMTNTNNKLSSIISDSYLMNESDYFFVKYIHKNGLNASTINKTALYDSNKNEATTEYNKTNYYKTLTKEEENSFKKFLLAMNFFKLKSSYPISVENVKDRQYNSYNLTVTIDNKTNSVYWLDKNYTTTPAQLYVVKDKIENWISSSSPIKKENPTTILTPICGPVEGFNFNIKANGFAPNRTVHWELLDKDQQPALLGYIETNNTGGFNETEYATDILPDKYQLHLYDDKDNDAHEDWAGSETFRELSIPCNSNSNNSTNFRVS